MSDLISIIIPIYNVDAYLFQCVDSVLKQTYRDLEIILVNDGSTDKSQEICESFRKSDSRVLVITKPNGGLVSARKAGLRAAKGNYIFYLDGDDWLDLDCLYKYYSCAILHDVDIVLGNFKREFLGNYVLVQNSISSGLYDKNQMKLEVYPKMIYDGNFFQHGIRTYSWGKLYKRDVIEKLQAAIPNEIIVGEDAALIYPAIYRSNKIFIMDYAGCNYRQRSNSILKTVSLDYSREINGLQLLTSFLTKHLDLSDEKSNFLKQLKVYFMSLVVIRTGAFLGDQSLSEKFSLYGVLKPGTKVCLYNSGSFGQHVYKSIQLNKNLNFAGWCDEDHIESAMLGLPVNSPNEIKLWNFDVLLIASLDFNSTNVAREYFQRIGIKNEKIRTISLSNELEGYLAERCSDLAIFQEASL